MKKVAVLLVAALAICPTWLLLSASEPELQKAPQASTPIRVLFLGDQGHHKPAERARQLLPYLASRGIEARYSEDQDDLNPKTLAGVDCLLIFANDESITPGQES